MTKPVVLPRPVGATINAWGKVLEHRNGARELGFPSLPITKPVPGAPKKPFRFISRRVCQWV